jgi:sialic acid synthase SpsE
MKIVHFGDIPVGEDVAPVLLPDIDMFFNKDLILAEKIICELVSSNVNLIKGAVIHDASIALDDGTMESYFNPNEGMVSENYRALMERKVMTFQEHEQLFKLCLSLGPGLVLSIYDIAGAEFAKDIGACALKIPSTNITHEPLISMLGKLGLPVLLDTGKSTLEEISRAVQWARDGGVRDLVIEHSPEAPPSSLSNHNLKMLNTLKMSFDCPVGLSDHHAGDEMMYAAIAIGASVIEKGVYFDGQEYDQDVYHAMKVSRVKEVWSKCLNIHEALGDGMRYLQRDRIKPSARMGLVASCDLTEGETISLDSTSFSFPAKGVPTECWSLVKGWRLKNKKSAGSVIEWCDLEPNED